MAAKQNDKKVEAVEEVVEANPAELQHTEGIRYSVVETPVETTFDERTRNTVPWKNADGTQNTGEQDLPVEEK